MDILLVHRIPNNFVVHNGLGTHFVDNYGQICPYLDAKMQYGQICPWSVYNIVAEVETFLNITNFTQIFP